MKFYTHINTEFTFHLFYGEKKMVFEKMSGQSNVISFLLPCVFVECQNGVCAYDRNKLFYCDFFGCRWGGVVVLGFCVCVRGGVQSPGNH